MAHDSYVLHRNVVYSIVWVFAVIELGLTAYRINHTESAFDTYDPIVVELLVTSILTIIWVPVTFIFHRGLFRSESTSNKRLGFLHGETARSLILWIMWLVGGAIATNKWPNRAYAGPGKQGSILLTIIAFAWMIFGFLTIAKVFSAMEYAAIRALKGADGLGPTHAREKPANGTAANNVANGATAADPAQSA